MSRFSGKCDLYDHCGDYTDSQLQETRFYIGRNIVPLKIETQKDLSPYYPHLVSVAGCSDGVSVVHFTEDSFIDREEAEHLTWKLDSLKKYCRKCKRSHVPYDEEEAIKKAIFFHETGTDVNREMARRVGESGDKATIEGLHDSLHEYYRNNLFEEMVRLGWPEEPADYWIWRDFERIRRYSNGKY